MRSPASVRSYTLLCKDRGWKGVLGERDLDSLSSQNRGVETVKMLYSMCHPYSGRILDFVSLLSLLIRPS